MSVHKKFVYAYELHFLGNIQKSYTQKETTKMFAKYHYEFASRIDRRGMTMKDLIGLYTSFEIIHHIPRNQ